jgi:putative transcriptional regulator
MSPRHHLDAATVLGFGAGALPPELAVVAATHLEVCAHCREQLHAAERVGGLLVDQQQPVGVPGPRRLALRQAMLDQLEQPLETATLNRAQDEPAPRSRDPDCLPAALHPYFGASYRALKWRWMAPGVHMIRATGTRTLLLLRIAPGKSMPVHSHGRNELTQILQGSYVDALGMFSPGDVADLDSDVEHQPVTTPGVACICVSALDAPLRFPGWLARTLQPLFDL